MPKNPLLLTQENIPQGYGFKLFSPFHIFTMIIEAVFITTLSLIYRHISKKSEHSGKIFLISMSAFLVFLEIIKIIFLVLTHQFRANYLPFDLCDISVFLLMYASLKNNIYIDEFIFAVSLPGAALALIFPDWNNLPFLNFMSLHSFIMHTFLVTDSVCISIGLEHSFKRLPTVFGMLAGTAVFAALLNHFLGTDFLFLSTPSPGSPIEWSYDLLGNPGYIAGFLPMIAIVWIFLYGVPFLFKKLKNKLSSAPK